ncbi:hypothetical protein BRPE64_ACDS14150 [Caballeronia insecticola]|uniref:Uncharacterized protein n=1 Tax=Caballeronia insecticola TaxID=758793 RepID=R4WGW4_9BURK|nr:hypothetical protein BRPE64_ACDS14150 [Caballeronia insecticola]
MNEAPAKYHTSRTGIDDAAHCRMHMKTLHPARLRTRMSADDVRACASTIQASQWRMGTALKCARARCNEQAGEKEGNTIWTSG